MSTNRVLGWTAFVLLVVAMLVIALVVFTSIFEQLSFINPGAGLWAAGVLALVAAVTGFLSFGTPQGKVASVGGTLMVIAILLVTPVSTQVSAGNVPIVAPTSLLPSSSWASWSSEEYFLQDHGLAQAQLNRRNRNEGLDQRRAGSEQHVGGLGGSVADRDPNRSLFTFTPKRTDAALGRLGRVSYIFLQWKPDRSLMI